VQTYQFSDKKTIQSSMHRLRIKGYPCESNMPLYSWKVSWNYVHICSL